MVWVPPGTTSLIAPLTLTSYSMRDAGSTSSLAGDHRSQSSSGHAPLPPSRALTSTGLVGATESGFGAVVAPAVLLAPETLPDGSIARTVNEYAVPGSSWRTVAPWTAGAGVPGGTVDTTSGDGTPLTRTS